MSEETKKYVGIGMALGIIFGAVFGQAILGNVGVSVAMGMIFGAVIGAAISRGFASRLPCPDLSKATPCAPFLRAPQKLYPAGEYITAPGK